MLKTMTRCWGCVALIMLVGCVLAGCMSTKPTDRVVSEPAIGSVKGPVYYLPLTALVGSVPVTIVEYKDPNDNDKRYYAAEIREKVNVKPAVLPDPHQRYVIRSADLSKNPFLLSNLSFGMSELGLLTSVSAEVNDERLDAFAEGVKLVGNIARFVAGVPPGALAVVAAPATVDKSLLTEVKELGKISIDFVKIPIASDPNSREYDAEIPDWFDGKPISYKDSFMFKVTDDMPGSGVLAVTGKGPKETVPFADEEHGIFYRTPKYMSVDSTIVHKFSNTNEMASKTNDYLPFMQFGEINSLPVQAKRFTNRTTTVTFGATDGTLSKYGVNSQSSAKRVLETANSVISEGRSLQSELAALKAQERQERLAEQKQRFEQLKKLQAYCTCVASGGTDCTEALNAFIGSFFETSDE